MCILPAMLMGTGMAMALLLSPAPLRAEENAAPEFVLACAPCHGFDGIGNDPAVPNLAGQHGVYLHNQLVAFRNGARKHPVMNFFSGQMTPEEIDGVIEYYAGLQPR